MVLLKGEFMSNYVAKNLIKSLTVVGKDRNRQTRTKEERVDAASSRRLVKVKADTVIVAVCVFDE